MRGLMLLAGQTQSRPLDIFHGFSLLPNCYHLAIRIPACITKRPNQFSTFTSCIRWIWTWIWARRRAAASSSRCLR